MLFRSVKKETKKYDNFSENDNFKPEAEKENHLKAGKWNTLTIKVVNDEVTTWLNGHQMIYIKDEKIGKGTGFIALQIHDGGGIKVRWKKLMIESLP